MKSCVLWPTVQTDPDTIQVPGWKGKNGPMLFRVRIRVDAWYANIDVIAPPLAWQHYSSVKFCFVWFCSYSFCSFKYSSLANLITNCTLKSIFCSIYKVWQLPSPPRLYVCIQRAALMHAPPRLLLFFVENQRHTVSLKMYYSVSTSLRRNFWRKTEEKNHFRPCRRGPSLFASLRKGPIWLVSIFFYIIQSIF